MRVIFKKEVGEVFPQDTSERYVIAFNVKLLRDPSSDGYYTDGFDVEGKKDFPPELTPYIAQVSVFDEFPAFPARQIGEYEEEGGTHAVVDIRFVYINGGGYGSDRCVPLYKLKAWGTDVEKVRELYSRIRAGHARATVPWDGHQVGAFNLIAELGKLGIEIDRLRHTVEEVEV